MDSGQFNLTWFVCLFVYSNINNKYNNILYESISTYQSHSCGRTVVLFNLCLWEEGIKSIKKKDSDNTGIFVLTKNSHSHKVQYS